MTPTPASTAMMMKVRAPSPEHLVSTFFRRRRAVELTENVVRVKKYMCVVKSHDTSDTDTALVSHDIGIKMSKILQDSKREHACERHTLTKGDLYFGKVLRRPEKDDEIAQRILCRMEVVDRLNVETLCFHKVLEDIPICAGRSAQYS